MISRIMKYDFKDTENRIINFLKNKGFKIFDIINQSKEASNVGLSIPNTDLIIFGNPKYGTILMQSNDNITFELPSKVLLIDNVNNTKIIYKDPYEFDGVNLLSVRASNIIHQMHNMYNEMVNL